MGGARRPHAGVHRIGRSLRHVVELVDGLQQRSIGLKVLTGGIDTTSATGRLVFGIFATLSDYVERVIMRSGMAPPWRSAWDMQLGRSA